MMEFDVINGKPVERKVKPIASFMVHPVLDRVESDKKGRRVYKEVLYIKKRATSSKDCISRKATESDFNEFPEEYKAFQNNETIGTDVALLVTKIADLANLAELGIRTVEQLADIDALPGELVQYRNKARAYIQLLKGDEDGTEEREATG